MLILGVDPGTRRTGVGLIEGQGNRYRLIHTEIIHAKGSLPLPERLLKIYHSLVKIITEYQPVVLALEDVFYSKDVRALIRIGEARTCAMLAASERGISVVEYAPARVKQAVSGNGRATKNQVQQMVKVLLNLESPPPADGADALALAICHLHSERSISKGLRTKPASLRSVGSPGY